MDFSSLYGKKKILKFRSDQSKNNLSWEMMNSPFVFTCKMEFQSGVKGWVYGLNRWPS